MFFSLSLLQLTRSGKRKKEVKSQIWKERKRQEKKNGDEERDRTFCLFRCIHEKYFVGDDYSQLFYKQESHLGLKLTRIKNTLTFFSSRVFFLLLFFQIIWGLIHISFNISGLLFKKFFQTILELPLRHSLNCFIIAFNLKFALLVTAKYCLMVHDWLSLQR